MTRKDLADTADLVGVTRRSYLSLSLSISLLEILFIKRINYRDQLYGGTRVPFLMRASLARKDARRFAGYSRFPGLTTPPE